jgi:hypothetical protein
VSELVQHDDTILMKFASSAISAIADAAPLQTLCHYCVPLCGTIPATAGVAPSTNNVEQKRSFDTYIYNNFTYNIVINGRS